MKKVLLMNGPPRSGKDTICNYVMAKRPNATHLKFAKHLKGETHKYFGVDRPWDFYEGDIKDQPLSEFNGMTPRQAYIHYSEDIIKPKYGKDYWAKLLVDEIEESQSEFFVVSDLGFPEEWEILVSRFEEMKIGIVRVFRGTCDYSADSRGYVNVRGPWTKDTKEIFPKEGGERLFSNYILKNCWDIQNNFDLDSLYPSVDIVCNKFFGKLA